MSRRMARAAAVLFLGAAAVSATLWPEPQSATLTDGSRALSASFAITTSSGSALLARGVARYAKIIGASAPALGREAAARRASSGVSVASLVVTVSSSSEALNDVTDYSYTLTLASGSGTATVAAKTVFGALYGLETFSQLVVDGALAYDAVSISDYPKFVHRGLLVDSGRRFVTPALLENTIDGMAYSKMNVMHIHMSDWSGFRFAVAAYPELTSGLNGQARGWGWG